MPKKGEFLVEKLVEMKTRGKTKLYLVKWKGYDSKDNTWEPASNLAGLEDEMAQFEDEEEPEAAEKKKSPKSAAERPPPERTQPKRAAPEPEAPPAKKAKEVAEEKASAKPKKETPTIDVAKMAAALQALITGKPVKEDADAPKKRSGGSRRPKARRRLPQRRQHAAAALLHAAALLCFRLARVVPLPALAPRSSGAVDRPPAAVGARCLPRLPPLAPTAFGAYRLWRLLALAILAGVSARAQTTEVVEVDKILAMKVNVKGGLIYQILWMDGSKSWEPEDNVMDDDLVDEFEAAEQAKAYSNDDIKVGSEVEVKNVADGFENSWSEASVTKKEKGNKFTVEFTGFVDDDGNADTEGGIDRERLRLVPDQAEKGWVPALGEIIEVNEDDCWWEARVLDINGKKANVQLRVSDELKTCSIGTKKVRPCSWLNLAGKKK